MNKETIIVEHPSGQISAKIIAHSISPKGKELITWEIEYPRIILSELNTHRMLSKNSSSSRAIPINKVIEMVKSNPAMPVRFGQHQPGMQDQGVEFDAKVELAGFERKLSGREAWIVAAKNACQVAEAMHKAGYAKQVVNRILEPFQRMKTVISGTELENFFWLRCDADADPTIEALANAMRGAKERSIPELLYPGEWHTPYVEHVYIDNPKKGEPRFNYVVQDSEGNDTILSTEQAKAISTSCCAQVSYRRLDNSKEKALNIYDKLIDGAKVHSSPLEHQGSPMEHETQLERTSYMLSVEVNQETDFWPEGATHIDRDGVFSSGNFKGWTQHRQLIPNNVKEG